MWGMQGGMVFRTGDQYNVFGFRWGVLNWLGNMELSLGLMSMWLLSYYEWAWAFGMGRDRDRVRA